MIGIAARLYTVLGVPYSFLSIVQSRAKRIQTRNVENPQTLLRTLDGTLLLAYRKCQKKLKREKRLIERTKIKKAVRNFNRRQSAEKMHVLNIPCMGLCPQNGVTVFVPSRESGHLVILHSEGDLERLHSGN
jgi:hypothetical protein